MSSHTIKIAIADDDITICNYLKNLLSSYNDLKVVGTATDGNKLIDIVKATNPHALIVDVQMPNLDGLSVVYQLQQEYPSLYIIFFSAYAHYAVEAFNLEAVDYLVKPVDRARLNKALNRVRNFINSNFGAHLSTGSENSAYRTIANNTDRLVLKTGNGVILLDPLDILYIEKMLKKCITHTIREQYCTSDSLASMEMRLNPAIFFRCHKSFIINVRQVHKIIPYADRSYEVSFHNYSHKVTMRRDKFEQFCSMIGGVE